MFALNLLPPDGYRPPWGRTFAPPPTPSWLAIQRCRQASQLMRDRVLFDMEGFGIVPIGQQPNDAPCQLANAIGTCHHLSLARAA